MKYIKTFERAKTIDPFIQAAKRGSSSKIREIIKNGVDINMQDGEQKTALMYASLYKFLMVVDILIKAGADVNLQDFNKRSALFMASTPSIINKLLDAGIDVNIQNNEGDTAIMEFIKYWSHWSPFEMILLLRKFLEKGLDVYIENNEHLTFYGILKDYQEKEKIKSTNTNQYILWLNLILDTLDNEFPEMKKDWELKNDMKKYNL